ncbi:MAG TPA: alpha/beta fold hydrolase [Solirubrobacteraceae bacterium]
MVESIVLLHGFAGSHRAFDRIVGMLAPKRYLPLALDLPGHGRSRATRPVAFADCVEFVLDNSPEHFTLCGYSMGGRIALQLALDAPQRVRRLVLVSSTAGIEEPSGRRARVAADARLAARLEQDSYEQFIDDWRSQLLFAGDPPEVDSQARAEYRHNDPSALAEVLRGAGTGTMPSLWHRLQEVAMPVSVLVGTRDRKFQEIGRRMAQALPSGELITLDGGHNLLLENPEGVAEALMKDQRPPSDAVCRR